MERLDVCDAKARFPDLIDRAQAGFSTIITRRGRVVAKIVPAKAPAWDRSAVLNAAEALRRTLKVARRVNLAKLVGSGRR